MSSAEGQVEKRVQTPYHRGDDGFDDQGGNATGDGGDLGGEGGDLDNDQTPTQDCYGKTLNFVHDIIDTSDHTNLSGATGMFSKLLI